MTFFCHNLRVTYAGEERSPSRSHRTQRLPLRFFLPAGKRDGIHVCAILADPIEKALNASPVNPHGAFKMRRLRQRIVMIAVL